MKKFLCLLLSVLLLLTVAGAFSDVTDRTEGGTAIAELSSRGILTGYEDGTFRPENPVTRAEAAAVVVRLMGYETDEPASVYSDVGKDFWGRPFIMAATREGVLDGMGNGKFAPQEQVTYYQFVKMLVCAAGHEKRALELGGWPRGYADAAKETGIINGLQRHIVAQAGDRPAPRSAVASYSYNLLQQTALETVTFMGTEYRLGQSAENLPKADEVVQGGNGWVWHLYGTETYRDFYAIGVMGGKICALGAEGPSFLFDGRAAGDVYVSASNEMDGLLFDKHDGNKIHGVLLVEDNLQLFFVDITTPEAIHGEARVNFHCTNAFRVMHGLAPLEWSEQATEAARLHSLDMARQNYFSHDSLDGRKFSQRLDAQGIGWSRCAENIYAGCGLGFMLHDGWVNSAGHRKNILSDTRYLGVGGGYSKDSDHGIYFTQDFFR